MESLEKLKSDDFIFPLAFIATAGALRAELKTRDEITNVLDALRSGELQEADIRNFIGQIMSDYRPGVTFPYDRTLSALAVVLESTPGELAQEFLESLSGLKNPELVMSPTVASASLIAWRRSVAENASKNVKWRLDGNAAGFSWFYISSNASTHAYDGSGLGNPSPAPDMRRSTSNDKTKRIAA